MTDPNDIPRAWKLTILAVILLAILGAGSLLVRSLIHHGDACTSEAHLVDLCATPTEQEGR